MNTMTEKVSVDQFAEFAAAVTRQLPRNMSSDRMQRYIDDQGALHDLLVDAFAEEDEHEQPATLSEPCTILSRLYEGEEIVIGATDGAKTLAKAERVFTGYLDPDFTRWETDVPCKKTNPTAARIYEMRQDATFQEMFGSLGDPNTLIWEQSQIIAFCETRRDKLTQDGSANFFLFKVGNKLFVARVRVDDRRLVAYVSQFAYDNVWLAGHRHRVVVPQL